MANVAKKNGILFDVTPMGAIMLGHDPDYKIDIEKELEVPTIVDGKPVVQIADNAFFRTPVRKWSLPATIHKIGERAFSNSDVEKVIFYASSVHPYKSKIYVGKQAFKNCKNLKLFSSMQTIAADELAFFNCENLTTESMRHEMRLHDVQTCAFAGCRNLHEIFVASGATLWQDALKDSSIDIIHFDKDIHMDKTVLDFIRISELFIITSRDSELVELSYEGVHVTVV